MMKRYPRLVLGVFVLAAGSCILVAAILLLAAGDAPGFLFFINRWVRSPDWSPDGGTIAFTCHYPSLAQLWADGGKDLFNWGYVSEGTEICTIKANGQGLARLTDNQVTDGHPTWSPDGQFIAYLSGSEMEGQVQVIRKDGQSLSKFGENLDVIWWEKPEWSPDGDKICFAAADLLYPSQGLDLYVAVLESEVVYALTTLAGDEVEFQWSPDGSLLAFAWFPKGFQGLLSEGAAVLVTDEEGSSSIVVEGFAGVGDLTWSPDGGRIAFWAYRGADCVYHCAEVYVVDLADNSLKSLTEQYELDIQFEVAWAPDGKRIAFIGGTSQGRGVYTITPSGQELSRIAPLLGTDHNLVWAPNGQFIAFERRAEGDKTRIWLIHVDTGTLRQLKTP